MAGSGVSLKMQIKQYHVHTDGTPFCVIFSDAFYRVQIHVYLLTRPKFCQDNVLCSSVNSFEDRKGCTCIPCSLVLAMEYRRRTPTLDRPGVSR